VTAWHKREQARFVRAHRADASLLRTAAGWVFGALLLTSPFWLLWSLASRDSGGSLLPFLAATIVSFLLTEDWWPEPAEREPVMDEFARSVWGLEWDAMVTARSREPNWQAGLARREQARAQRDEARARAMREVADRAVANRPADELPFL
jgi:hypothetical protein